jgi:hypothetical protein
METTTRKKKWWVYPLIIIGVLYVGVSITAQSVRAYHTNQAEREAKRWLKEAEEDAQPTWTEKDAVSWLQQHNFEDVATGKGTHSSIGHADEHFFSAIGFRPFEEGNMLVKPSSVYVEFYFNLDHRFVGVKSKVWPFEPPGRSEAGQ